MATKGKRVQVSESEATDYLNKLATGQDLPEGFVTDGWVVWREGASADEGTAGETTPPETTPAPKARAK